MVTAAAVATLNIEYATDEHGAPIVPPVQFKEGFVRSVDITFTLRPRKC